MNLPWQPRFVCGDIDFSFSMPMRPPTPGNSGIGGSETSAAEIPASYKVRRDRTLSVPLRFTEDEWPEVEELIELMQSNPIVSLDTPPIAFYADQNQDEPTALCYLDAPAMCSPFRPKLGDFMGTYELTIELRRREADGRWDIRYFTDVLES